MSVQRLNQPYDSWSNIFSFFDPPELMNGALTCKDFRAFAKKRWDQIAQNLELKVLEGRLSRDVIVAYYGRLKQIVLEKGITSSELNPLTSILKSSEPPTVAEIHLLEKENFKSIISHYRHPIPDEIKEILESLNPVTIEEIRLLKEYIKARDKLVFLLAVFNGLRPLTKDGGFILSSPTPVLGIDIQFIEMTNFGSVQEINETISSLMRHCEKNACFSSVQRLHLSLSYICFLPSEIGLLRNLHTLDLEVNDLFSLPPEIGQLGNLHTLDLSSNKFSSLPPEIGQLGNLHTLNLSSNKFSSLPPEIGLLGNLHTLNLRFNKVSSLPPQIGQLGNLHELNLYGNLLTFFPPEIGQLGNLQTLNLASNRLTALTSQLGNLGNLQNLYLCDNFLTSLPPEIGQLGNLHELQIGFNGLLTLPPEITRLENLFIMSDEGTIPRLLTRFTPTGLIQHLDRQRSILQNQPD